MIVMLYVIEDETGYVVSHHLTLEDALKAFVGLKGHTLWRVPAVWYVEHRVLVGRNAQVQSGKSSR